MGKASIQRQTAFIDNNRMFYCFLSFCGGLFFANFISHETIQIAKYVNLIFYLSYCLSFLITVDFIPNHIHIDFMPSRCLHRALYLLLKICICLNVFMYVIGFKENKEAANKRIAFSTELIFRVLHWLQNNVCTLPFFTRHSACHYIPISTRNIFIYFV